MKKSLLDFVCCPVCKDDLSLCIEKRRGEEIVEGKLYCKKCGIDYPISKGIPNLLPPSQ